MSKTRSEAEDELRKVIDTLATDHADYDKCRLCPLGAGSVCFPNCAWWKSANKSLDVLLGKEINAG